ncbi:unnamed protein product [Rotaria sp. Silwood2]|nr:unnamed protein product [Rotaria sp. Silwood2]
MDTLSSNIGKQTTRLIFNEYIEIPFIFDLRFPCSIKEFEIIHNIHNNLSHGEVEMTIEDQAYTKLKQNSFYKNYFEDSIINNQYLFEQYYRDQLTILLIDCKIQLDIEFVFSLVYNKNSMKTSTDRIKYYLVYHDELKKLLKILNYGFEVLKDDINKTLFDIENVLNPGCFPLKTNGYYKLIIADNVIYQIPPNTVIDNAEGLSKKFLFECDGEPFVENCLMNLIELIITPKYIQDINNIQNILMIYARMSLEISSLRRYTVDNLEKLRPIINLLTSILALYDEPSKVFQMIMTKYITTNHLNTCTSIDACINHLKTLKNFKIGLDKNAINKILSKLEIELLKNWLYDNDNNYADLLKILNNSNNDLWRYSAKILTYFERMLEFAIIKTNHGQIIIDGPYKQLEQYLAQENMSTKIEHLLSNRIHLYLKQTIRKENIEISLNSDYKYFEENLIQLQSILNQKQRSHVKVLCLISWLKFYAEMYSFALIMVQSQHDIMQQIDRLLSNNNSKVCASIKIFIIKQMIYFANISLEELKQTLLNRNIVWIKPILLQQSNTHGKEQNNFILPTPLFECKTEYIQVNQLFKQFKEIKQLENLITKCQTDKNLTYSFYLWFIRYYTRFHRIKNVSIDISFVQMIENQLQQQLISNFEPIGYQFILQLCKNFDNQSYFQLKADMTDIDIHIRLVALNIFALQLASKCTKNSTVMNSLLFDIDHKMPKDYAKHLMTRCLVGLQPNNNHIMIQMQRVKNEVQKRLNNREINEYGKFIYQCSKNCYFMYYFENCGRPNDRSKCPLCKNDVGSVKRGSSQLLVRDPPQIQLSITSGFQLIDDYIKHYNETNRYGYYINPTQTDNSTVNETNEHLQPITYRLLHMFTHTLIMMLYDLKCLQSIRDKADLQVNYFRKHYQKDYELINIMIGQQNECHIWLYKIFNHLSSFNIEGILDTNKKVVDFEKHIEQNIILPHIQSLSDEIKQYNLAYSEFIREHNAQPQLIDYINELVENEQEYPLLNFLTITRSNNDIVKEFRSKFYLLQYEKLYPITDYFLKHLSELEQIEYMHPIINFTNYLLQKYNHRILRTEASTKELDFYIKNDSNDKKIFSLFQQFLQAWYGLKLNDVQLDCAHIKIDRTQSSEQFSKSRKLAFFLLNRSTDNSSFEILGCLHTLAKFQNNIINFYKHITNPQILYENTERKQPTIEIQKIKKEHLLVISSEVIDTILREENGYIINYEYGKTKEIIYDYDEIETRLCNRINRIQSINTENFNYFNYQFELYHQEVSLFNDIRRNIKQEQISTDEQAKLQQYLRNTKMDDVRQFLGSLDYVFTYLRHATDRSSTSTLKQSVQALIHNTSHLHSYILNEQQPFANIQLKYVINLYELIEELVFDEIMKNYVKQELTTDVCINEEEEKNFIEQFIHSTYMLDNISQQLKDPRVWLSVLKRLIIRVITANIDLNVSMQIYIVRTDLWNEDLVPYLDLINIPDNILVRHTYIILKGIETKLAVINNSNSDTKTSNESKNLRDWCQTKNEDINPSTISITTEMPTGNITKKKQRRVD